MENKMDEYGHLPLINTSMDLASAIARQLYRHGHILRIIPYGSFPYEVIEHETHMVEGMYMNLHELTDCELFGPMLDPLFQREP